MVGAELLRLFKIGIDEPYTGYYDNAKANTIFDEAYIRVIQDIYNAGIKRQKDYDQLSGIIVVNKQFTPKSGVLFHRPLAINQWQSIAPPFVNIITFDSHGLSTGETVEVQIPGTTISGNYTVISVTPDGKGFVIASTASGAGNSGTVIPGNCITDYYHFLYGEAQLEKPLNEKITSTTITPVFVTVDRDTEVRDGDYLKLSNGLTGYAYAKQWHERMLQLFDDKEFTQHYQSNTIYNTGSISLVVNSMVKLKPSDEKGASYGKPSFDNPVFQIAMNAFHFTPHPLTVSIDYIKQPPVRIDVNDTERNLLDIYPDYFLLRVVDMAIRLAGLMMRDNTLVASGTEQIITNP